MSLNLMTYDNRLYRVTYAYHMTYFSALNKQPWGECDRHRRRSTQRRSEGRKHTRDYPRLSMLSWGREGYGFCCRGLGQWARGLGCWLEVSVCMTFRLLFYGIWDMAKSEKLWDSFCFVEAEQLYEIEWNFNLLRRFFQGLEFNKQSYYHDCFRKWLFLIHIRYYSDENPDLNSEGFEVEITVQRCFCVSFKSVTFVFCYLINSAVLKQL